VNLDFHIDLWLGTYEGMVQLRGSPVYESNVRKSHCSIPITMLADTFSSKWRHIECVEIEFASDFRWVWSFVFLWSSSEPFFVGRSERTRGSRQPSKLWLSNYLYDKSVFMKLDSNLFLDSWDLPDVRMWADNVPHISSLQMLWVNFDHREHVVVKLLSLFLNARCGSRRSFARFSIISHLHPLDDHRPSIGVPGRTVFTSRVGKSQFCRREFSRYRTTIIAVRGVVYWVNMGDSMA
jgi:hypothetical protein